MKPSSFQERIEHQFDFICMRAMDDEQDLECIQEEQHMLDQTMKRRIRI